MQIIQLNKRLIAQFIAVLSALFLVHHYKEHYEDYYLEKHDDDARDLLADKGPATGPILEDDVKNDLPQRPVVLEKALKSTSLYDGKDAGFVMHIGRVMSESECESLITSLDVLHWTLRSEHNGAKWYGMDVNQPWASQFRHKILKRVMENGLPSEFELRLNKGFVYKNPRIVPGSLRWVKYETGQFMPAHRDSYSNKRQIHRGKKLTVVINLTGKNKKGEKAFEGGETKFMNDPSNKKDEGWSTTDNLLNVCSESHKMEAITGNGYLFEGSLMHGGDVVTKGTKYILIGVIEVEEYDELSGQMVRDYYGEPPEACCGCAVQ